MPRSKFMQAIPNMHQWNQEEDNLAESARTTFLKSSTTGKWVQILASGNLGAESAGQLLTGTWLFSEPESFGLKWGYQEDVIDHVLTWQNLNTVLRVNTTDSPRGPSLASMLPLKAGALEKVAKQPFIHHIARDQNPVKWPVKVLLSLYRGTAQQSQAHNEWVTLIHSDIFCWRKVWENTE